MWLSQVKLRIPSFVIYWATTVLLIWWNLASCSVVLLLLEGLPALLVSLSCMCSLLAGPDTAQLHEVKGRVSC